MRTSLESKLPTYSRKKLTMDDDDDDKPETSSKRRRKEEQSILEMLRQNRIAVIDEIWNPILTKTKDGQRMMELILEHRSKFPSKVRPAIESAAWGKGGDTKNTKPAPPHIFLRKVFYALEHFFFGRTFLGGQEPFQYSEWHGLDQTVDTQDQVEVAIRFFPRVLIQRKSWSDVFLAHPINWLLTSAKAVSFAPFFFRLGVEFYPDRFVKGHLRFEFGYEYCRDGIQRQLFINRYPKTVFGERSSPELDRESLLALRKLEEMGLVNKDKKKLGELMDGLFRFAAKVPLDASFVATRFKLLMEWNPSVWLKFATSKHLHSVPFFWHLPKWAFGRKNKDKFRACEDMLKLGIYSFPLKLGQIFRTKSNIGEYAQFFGKKRLSEMVHEAIARVVREQETISLREWVAAVAANEEIFPDGLYTLIRYNPVEALVPKEEHLTTGA